MSPRSCKVLELWLEAQPGLVRSWWRRTERVGRSCGERATVQFKCRRTDVLSSYCVKWSRSCCCARCTQSWKARLEIIHLNSVYPASMAHNGTSEQCVPCKHGAQRKVGLLVPVAVYICLLLSLWQSL